MRRYFRHNDRITHAQDEEGAVRIFNINYTIKITSATEISREEAEELCPKSFFFGVWPCYVERKKKC